MKQIKSGYFLVLVILGVFAGSNTARAYSSCDIQPFATTITQGESANLSVSLTLDDPTAPYELSLGNLPNNVTGGFSQTQAVNSNSVVRNVPLTVSTASNAQTGSFMITVIAQSALAGAIYQTYCQFNLDIKQGASTSNSSPSNTASTNYIQTSQLPDSVGTGNLPPPVAVSSAPQNTGNTAAPSPYLPPPTLPVVAPFAPQQMTNQKITASMQRGSRGAQVLLLQQILQSLKFFPADEAPTGYFGVITEAAVKAFQASKGIETLGIVGPLTRRAFSELPP